MNSKHSIHYMENYFFLNDSKVFDTRFIIIDKIVIVEELVDCTTFFKSKISS